MVSAFLRGIDYLAVSLPSKVTHELGFARLHFVVALHRPVGVGNGVQRLVLVEHWMLASVNYLTGLDEQLVDVSGVVVLLG